MAVPQPGVWGIDLGQCALKAIRFEEIDGEITATAFDYIEHPKILSQPDADPDQLTREALDKFLSRNNLRGDTVVISVPGQSGLARFVKLPPVEEKKIGDIVRFEAKQQIPFPLDEVVWDFQKLSSGVVTDGFALETEIGLFAMKRDMVNRYLQHFQDVNVEVQIVQMAPLALCNFVTHDLLKVNADGEEEDDDSSGKKQCIVALDIGTDNSNLVITDGAKIIWQRPIPIGGNHFTRALTKDLKLTFAKAEHLKRNAVKSPDLKKILGALRPVLTDFVSEVQRSLGYFTNTHRDAHVKYMVGLGNAFRLPGLQKFIQEKLQLEVKKLTGFKRLEGESVTSAPQFTENILSFAVAYGLGLQGLQKARIGTNLLPQEIRFERVIRAKKPWAAAAAGILLLGVCLLTLARSVQQNAWARPSVKTALDEGKKQYDRKISFANQTTDQESKLQAAIQARKRLAAGAEERFNWPLFYKYVNEALPRPDGKNLPRTKTRSGVDAYETYFDKNKNGAESGQAAWEKAAARRLAAGGPDGAGKDAQQQEDAIKKHLVQINFEALFPMYTDDLPAFFTSLQKAGHKFPGLTNAEKVEINAPTDKFPKRGWVVEVRGYTYNARGWQFVQHTFLEKLMNPEASGTKFAKDEPLKTIVRDRVRYGFVYKWAEDKNPLPGQFRLIQASSVPAVLGGGPLVARGPVPPDPKETETSKTTPTRAGWRPDGEAAAQSFSATAVGGPAGFGGVINQPRKTGEDGNPLPEAPPRPMRTEFVLFFVWLEPLPTEATPGTTP